MAERIALVSIVAGAAVAIIVPFITALLEKGRLKWQRDQQRDEELRSLLDAAALHLEAGRLLLHELVRTEVITDTRFEELRDSYTEATKRMMDDAVRLRLRVPDDATVLQAHAKVLDVHARCEGALNLMTLEVFVSEEFFDSLMKAGAGFQGYLEAVRGAFGITELPAERAE